MTDAYRLSPTNRLSACLQQGRARLGVDKIKKSPADFFCFFSVFIKGLLLTMPIIYNRIKEIDMTFFVLLLLACFVGFLGAEVLQ